MRQRTIDLSKPLKTEDYVPQPVEFTSPPKWHLAHTTWFFEEMILTKRVENYKVFNEKFGFLFNSYYQHVGERTLRADRGNMTRPEVNEVLEYRKYVDEHMIKLLSGNVDSSIRELVTLGLNHEQQHQELFLTDLKYSLSLNPLFPVYKKDFCLVDDVNENDGWLNMEEGIYEIGFSGDQFCFDNERDRHKVYLQEYAVSKSLVKNSEYMDFMNDGGYKRFELWHDEGWTWVTNNRIKSPLYWHKEGNQWFNYTLDGLKVVNPEAILSHISFYEASAFAQWKKMRLPTEFEWEAASGKLSWGSRWEWTNSAYLPYPGFKIADGAVGEYNGKFMINQMVLRGGSTATAENHSRNTYRNFFHPHFQWQFSGIRLAK